MRQEAPHHINADFKDVDGMTLADWRARAAIMGMSYYRVGHYFYTPSLDPGPTARFDADTLRPIDLLEARDGPTLFYANGDIVPEEQRGAEFHRHTDG